MNKSAAMARLGLTAAADVHTITLAYTERLTQAQHQLATSQTDERRQQSHATVAELVEAYELLTGMQRTTRGSSTLLRADALADNATVIRSADEVETLAAASVPPSAASTGTVIAERFEVGVLLGHGGMGYVYAAHDRIKDEDVAIKVLRQDLSLSVAAKERFLAEAKVSCSLSHPNIVRVHDVGISGGQYYFSMERLKGQTLRQYMQSCQRSKRPMRLDEILGIVRQLFEALDYAHRYIVHRDLKPENIWLAADGTVKLMDFGIARAYSHSQMITKEGTTLGTAYYMSPEQQKAAQEVDWRADQYSLGVVLYEMLSGTVPMGAATPLPKLRRDLPKRAAQAVMRAMAPNAEDRWPSLDEMSEALHARPSHTGKIAAAVLLVGGVVAGTFGYEELSARIQTVSAPLASTSGAAFRGNFKLPQIVAPSSELVLPEPGGVEIASNLDSVRSGGVIESEIIETEFIEPERVEPTRVQPVAQRIVTQPAQREVVYQAPPVQARTYLPEPRHEPRFDSRRPPPDFMPPPPPPPGMRPPPGMHPPPGGRPPPRR